VTDCAADIVTVQVAAAPVQAPLQPVKVEEASGEAVKVTSAPPLKVAAQVVPQPMPAGVELTVPPPAPALVTVRVYVATAVNVAVTEVAPEGESWQVDAPLQAPPQPVKV
jgi:hypothetical protein